MTRQEWIYLGSILALTAVMFGRAISYDFVNWDDDFNIGKNPYVQQLDWRSIRGIFTSNVLGNYNPLATLTFAIENGIWGLNPTVYHTTNVVLHLGTVLLAYRLMRLLGLRIALAAAATILFAIHPLKIESVAWVTERKDVLFGVFYVGALTTYCRWFLTKSKKGSGKYLITTLVLFVLSLLSKIQAVALPLSLICVDYLLTKGNVTIKDLVQSGVRKWLFFVLSLIVGVVGIFLLKEQGSLGGNDNFNFVERLLIGAYSYCVYLVKFVVPYRISPLYPYPAQIHWMMYVSLVMAAAVVAGIIRAFNKGEKQMVFGLVFFTVNVVFVLQVVGAGQAYLADRFTYIPYLGLGYATVCCADQWAIRSPALRTCVRVIGGIWITALLVINWITLPIWKNSELLWTHVLKYYENPLPYRNRAQYYRENGMTELALPDYNRSLELRENADVLNSRARLHFEQQNWQQALVDYNRAIEVKPSSGEFWINRGAVYANLGQMDAALSDISKGIELAPDFGNGYKSRAFVYQVQGKYALAKADYIRYTRIDPYDPTIWFELGRLQRSTKEFQQALSSFNLAIQYDASNGMFFAERAIAHAAMGNKAQARADLAQADALGAQVDPQTRNAILQ